MTTERFMFTTVNGYKSSVTEQVATIRKLLEAYAAIAYLSGERGIELKMAAEIRVRLAHLHNVFARMILTDEIIISEIEANGSRMDCLDHQGCDYLEEELTFVAGVVNDPYLYASEPANYQQAAVVGLHKARDILEFRVNRMARNTVAA